MSWNSDRGFCGYFALMALEMAWIYLSPSPAIGRDDAYQVQDG